MAVINLEITFDTDKADKDGNPVRETKQYTLIPEKLPLALIEGMEDRKFGLMRRALARLLKLTDAQSEQLTIDHLNQLGQAMQEAQDIPKA